MRGQWTTLRKSRSWIPRFCYRATAARPWRTFSSFTVLRSKLHPTTKLWNRKRYTSGDDGVGPDNASLETRTVTAHGLPLSPLMDPKMVAARNRYRNPKPQAKDSDKSAFSEKLKRNPYGTPHILSLSLCYDLSRHFTDSSFRLKPKPSQHQSATRAYAKLDFPHISTLASPSFAIPLQTHHGIHQKC